MKLWLIVAYLLFAFFCIGHYVLPPLCRSSLVFLLFSLPNLRGRWLIVITLCHVFMVTQIHKIPSEFWVAHSPKIWRPKTSKLWRNFTHVCDLVTNIFGTQQDISNLEVTLQTMDTPTQANLIRCTLVHKWQKNGTGVLTHPTGGHHAVQCLESSFLCCCYWYEQP